MLNTVCYDYLNQTFVDFIGYLSMVSYVVSLYTQCLRYNICIAWFLDIRISISKIRLFQVWVVDRKREISKLCSYTDNINNKCSW